MKSLLTTIVAGLIVAAPQVHATTSAAATAAQVRAADVAFEKRAQEGSIARAFREYVDPVEGLRFGGGAPSRGAEAVAKSFADEAPQGSKLEWTPVDAWGSRGGDMGVTTGTWKFTVPGGAAPTVTGRYVTVWRKDAAGAWKALIDIGNPDPK